MECSSFFFPDQPRLPWFGDLTAQEGKLACPKCNNRVGAFKWTGEQCSCGQWICPSIQVQKAKVDYVKDVQQVTMTQSV